MTKRVVIGIIGIPVLLFAILSDVWRNFPFLFFLIVLNSLALNEMHYIFLLKKINLNKLYFLLSGNLIIISLYLGLCYNNNIDFRHFIFMLSIIIYFISLIFKNNYKDALLKISFFTFGLFYISYLSSYFLLLMHLPGGKYYLFLIVLLIWCNDSFAYCFGMLFGRKKLGVKASPEKSYAGVWGGVFASIVSVFISEMIFKEHLSMSFLQKMIIGTSFGIIVILSDLVESVLKRSVSIKDSKSLFPGHGGVLDIFDGWFLTIPLFYYYIKLTGI